MIEPGNTILFQGDSITDARRNRRIALPNYGHALGHGYCNLVAARLLRERPADNLKIYNRGGSGDRVVDLYARWKVDSTNLKPDIISILVGVNDTWYEFQDASGVEPDRFAMVYRQLLDYTRQQLPDVKLILCEPFVLECGLVDERWTTEMVQRQAIVAQLAAEFDARLVPFQSALNDALRAAPAQYWLADGVHPTPAGHYILAECWYATVVEQEAG